MCSMFLRVYLRVSLAESGSVVGHGNDREEAAFPAQASDDARQILSGRLVEVQVKDGERLLHRLGLALHED